MLTKACVGKWWTPAGESNWRDPRWGLQQVWRESDLLHSAQNEIWILDLWLNYPNWIFWILELDVDFYTNYEIQN